MPDQNLKELLESIKCELRESQAFTEEELEVLNSCLEPLDPPKDIESDTLTDSMIKDLLQQNKEANEDSANELLQCVSQLQEVANSVKEKAKEANIAATLRAKVEEVYLNLFPIFVFYEARNERFNELISGYQKATSSNQVTDFLDSAKESVSNFNGNLEDTLSFLINQYSSKEIVSFSFDSITVSVPSLSSTSVTSYEPDGEGQREVVETIPVSGNERLDPILFTSLKKVPLSFLELPIKSDEILDFYNRNISESYLYRRGSGYPGFFWKMMDPLNRFFTLDQRGLTLDQRLIDTNLVNSGTKSVKEGDSEFFIQDLEKFQSFYKDAVKIIRDAINKDLNETLPNESRSVIDSIKGLGKLAADQIVFNTPSVSPSSILSAGVSDSSYSAQLEQYLEIKERFELFKRQVDDLKKKENETVDPDSFKKAMGSVKCFPIQQDDLNNPECNVKEFLGIDPLGIKTVSGTESDFPDITTFCYWLEFAKIATLVNLMPIPDLSLTPGRTPGVTFRYWPIGLQIPTPGPPIKIPLPQIWLPLVVISTPFGIFVVLLAVCGIVPSPFLLFISPTGGKVFLASFKGISLQEMGFKVKDTTNPIGLETDGMSGNPVKGAFQVPLAALSAIDKSTRIAKELARTVANLPQQTLMPNGTPVPLNQGETAPPQYGQYEIMQQGVDKTGEFEDFVTGTKSKIMKQIDEIGDIPLNRVSRIQQGIRQGKKYTPSQIAQALSKDAQGAINKLKLGSITYPKDSGKMLIQPTALQKIITNFKNESSGGFKGVPSDFFDIKKLLLKYITRLNLDLGEGTFNLKKKSDIDKFRNRLKAVNKRVFGSLKGKANLSQSDDYNSSVSEAARVTSLLTLSLGFIQSAGSIQLSNPFRSCCSASKGVKIPTEVASTVLLALIAAEKIIEAAIQGLSELDLVRLAGGAKQVGTDAIKNVFQLILKSVPSLSLPKTLDLFNVGTLLTFISPIFAFLSLPQTPVFSVPGIPTQININLDNIVKPILSKAIGTALNSVSTLQNALPMNLIDRIGEVSSADLKALLKNQINSVFDSVINPVKPLFKLVDSIPSKKGVSKSIFDTAIPPLNLKAEINAAIKAAIPTSSLMMMTDSKALAGVVKTVLPTLEPIYKFPLSFIAVSAACALPSPAGPFAARLLHPVFNQDDLPPWERLSISNPLFVIFVDEVISKGADSTGIILGRSIV